MHNRPPIPIKEVINNEYGNKSEYIITNDYKTLLKQRSHAIFKPPKTSPRFINPLVEKFKNEKKQLDASFDDEELLRKKDKKPLYKLKMFQRVGSKIAESIK